MMSLWDALRMNMMISYQELVRTFLNVSCTVPPSPMPMAIINPEPQTMGIRNEIAVSRCPLGFAACHICFRDISHAL
ncbi:hypothetical protein CE180_13390 [Klebsiella pneumoniae]|nr:hypothetical protein CE180_13390 [Klebsiella pneumoniae]